MNKLTRNIILKGSGVVGVILGMGIIGAGGISILYGIALIKAK